MAKAEEQKKTFELMVDEENTQQQCQRWGAFSNRPKNGTIGLALTPVDETLFTTASSSQPTISPSFALNRIIEQDGEASSSGGLPIAKAAEGIGKH